MLSHYRSRYDWLALPHDVEANPNEAVVRMLCPRYLEIGYISIYHLGHPHREAWLEMGRQFKQQWFGRYAPPEPQEGHSPFGSMKVQVVRSVSDWSHGVLTEKSIQNACLCRITRELHYAHQPVAVFTFRSATYPRG